MVVKMMKWRPWPPLHSKKFKVNLLLCSLEGLDQSGDVEGSKLGVNVKWKGPSKGKLGSRFRRNVKRDSSAEHCVAENGVVEWNEEFEHVCVLTMGKEGGGFQPWHVCLEVVHNLMQEPKTKPSIIGTSFVNLGEFVSLEEDAKQSTKIPVSCCIGGVTTEAVFCITVNFLELQTSQEAIDAVHRVIVPSLSFIGGHLSSDKDEVSALKAGLRKVRIFTEYVAVGRSKKASEGEDGSDDKLSPRSEECEFAESIDSASADECEEDGADYRLCSGYKKSLSYGTLAAANLVVEGILHLDSAEKVVGNNWMMTSIPSLELMPKLIEEPSSSDSDHTLPQTSMRSLLSWKRRKVSFRVARERGEPLLNKACREEGGDDIDFDRRQSSFPTQLPPQAMANEVDSSVALNMSGCSDFGDDNFTIGSWEHKELVSRDGQMKLSAEVFFASIDQRSERAAGESACTALVAVIADWLQNNPNSMPIKSQFDTLIREGSMEWRKLWELEEYRQRFSDGHFDLETILLSNIRPLSVIPRKSPIGFFQPEGLGDSCEFLHGVMSFDSIWEEITNGSVNEIDNYEPRIYIVSWNDHFFLLKIEKEAYYIIDTLGERLFEGCNQAYILKFDKDTEVYYLSQREKKSEEEKNNTNLLYVGVENVENISEQQQENAGSQFKDTKPPEAQGNRDTQEKLICRGKEGCKEFIKGFLAAIPLQELQIDIKKGLMSNIQLHRRLQIEFHFTAESCTPSKDFSMV